MTTYYEEPLPDEQPKPLPTDLHGLMVMLRNTTGDAWWLMYDRGGERCVYCGEWEEGAPVVHAPHCVVPRIQKLLTEPTKTYREQYDVAADAGLLSLSKLVAPTSEQIARGIFDEYRVEGREAVRLQRRFVSDWEVLETSAAFEQ